MVMMEIIALYMSLLYSDGLFNTVLSGDMSGCTASFAFQLAPREARSTSGEDGDQSDTHA
jgi:hypothetical protein